MPHDGPAHVTVHRLKPALASARRPRRGRARAAPAPRANESNSRCAPTAAAGARSRVSRARARPGRRPARREVGAARRWPSRATMPGVTSGWNWTPTWRPCAERLRRRTALRAGTVAPGGGSITSSCQANHGPGTDAAAARRPPRSSRSPAPPRAAGRRRARRRAPARRSRSPARATRPRAPRAASSSVSIQRVLAAHRVALGAEHDERVDVGGQRVAAVGPDHAQGDAARGRPPAQEPLGGAVLVLGDTDTTGPFDELQSQPILSNARRTP